MQHAKSPILRPAPSAAGTPTGGADVADNPETGGSTAAQQLKRRLQAEMAECRALYRKLAPAQVWLEGRIAFSHEAQKADLEVQKLELDRKVKEAEQRIAQAHADIAALADPSSDASTYHTARREGAQLQVG
jgi:cytidylate kinase